MTMGFGESKTCEHRGRWGREVMRGLVFQTCYDCGKTWVLAELPELNRIYWEVVLTEEEVDAELAKLPTVVPDVPADEGVERVPAGPVACGRAARILFQVPEQPDGPVVSPEEGASQPSADAGDYEVLQPVQVREVPE